ncbi:MAG: glycosyltransferase family 4 protein [Microscillaceae bacterium]|nr:glycosyltransferase family 4 protein [Microscillaceae bacterium]
MSNVNLYQFGVYESASGGGVNEYLYQNAQLLKGDINIHFLNFDLDDPNAYEHKIVDENITIHRFGRLKYKGLVFPEIFKEWLAQLSSQENTIFHLHSVFLLSNFALARLLCSNKIPYIFTPHDSYSPESLRTKFLLKYLFLKSTEKFIMDHAQAVHAITDKGAKDIASYTKNKIKIITNFVPDRVGDTFNPPLTNHVCFIGRFDVYQKGIDLNLKAFQIFKKRTFKPTKFMMIGLKKPKQAIAVDKICKELHLEIGKDVIFMGKVSDAEKYDTLKDSRVYLQLSRFEGFGLSIVEALTCGKPVIISDKVPIYHLIRKYRAGWVVSNAEEAAEALIEVYKLDSEAYKELSYQARRCYEESFHPSIIKPELIRMYEDKLLVLA